MGQTEEPKKEGPPPKTLKGKIVDIQSKSRITPKKSIR